MIKTLTGASTKIKEADIAIKAIEEEISNKTQYSADDFANKIIHIFSGENIGSDTKSKLDKDGFPDNTRFKNLKKLLSTNEKYAAAFADQLAAYFIKNNIINTDVTKNDDKNVILLKKMYSFATKQLTQGNLNQILAKNLSKFIEEYNGIISNNIDIEKYNKSVAKDFNEEIKYYEFGKDGENIGIQKGLLGFSKKITDTIQILYELELKNIENIIKLYTIPLTNLQKFADNTISEIRKSC